VFVGSLNNTPFDAVGYRKSGHLDQAAMREYSCSMPLRRERQTTSAIGFPSRSLPSGARSPRLRCGCPRL
jgi:hypothetical protein